MTWPQIHTTCLDEGKTGVEMLDKNLVVRVLFGVVGHLVLNLRGLHKHLRHEKKSCIQKNVCSPPKSKQQAYQLDISIRHVGSGARAGKPRVRVVDVALTVDGLGIVKLVNSLAELRILLIFFALGVGATAVVVRRFKSQASQGRDCQFEAEIFERPHRYLLA